MGRLKPLAKSQGAVFFTALAGYLYDELTKAGISEEEASQSVKKAIESGANAVRGEQVYVSAKPIKEAIRRMAVADLKHLTTREVEIKYGFSQGYAAKIARQVRAQAKQ